jgi:hypothetical protein
VRMVSTASERPTNGNARRVGVCEAVTMVVMRV